MDRLSAALSTANHFLGGILILFIYVTRLASNEIFSSSTKLIIVGGGDDDDDDDDDDDEKSGYAVGVSYVEFLRFDTMEISQICSIYWMWCIT